jgi:hypothetical protein
MCSMHVPSALPHCAEKCIWLTPCVIQWHDSMFRMAHREKAGEVLQCMGMYVLDDHLGSASSSPSPCISMRATAGKIYNVYITL